MGMKMITVRSTLPPNMKTEVAAVLAARGISMAALARELLARIAARDAKKLAWLDKVRL